MMKNDDRGKNVISFTDGRAQSTYMQTQMHYQRRWGTDLAASAEMEACAKAQPFMQAD